MYYHLLTLTDTLWLLDAIYCPLLTLFHHLLTFTDTYWHSQDQIHKSGQDYYYYYTTTNSETKQRSCYERLKILEQVEFEIACWRKVLCFIPLFPFCRLPYSSATAAANPVVLSLVVAWKHRPDFINLGLFCFQATFFRFPKVTQRSNRTPWLLLETAFWDYSVREFVIFPWMT